MILEYPPRRLEILVWVEASINLALGFGKKKESFGVTSSLSIRVRRAAEVVDNDLLFLRVKNKGQLEFYKFY